MKKLALIALGLLTLSCGSLPTIQLPTPARVVGNHVSDLILGNGSLYFGAGTCLYQLGTENKTLRTILCTQEETFYPYIIDGQRAYAQVVVHTPERPAFLAAIDLSTGQVVWRTGDSSTAWAAKIYLIDGRIVAGRFDRSYVGERICVLDAQSGRQA